MCGHRARPGERRGRRAPASPAGRRARGARLTGVTGRWQWTPRARRAAPGRATAGTGCAATAHDEGRTGVRVPRGPGSRWEAWAHPQPAFRDCCPRCSRSSPRSGSWSTTTGATNARRRQSSRPRPGRTSPSSGEAADQLLRALAPLLDALPPSPHPGAAALIAGLEASPGNPGRWRPAPPQPKSSVEPVPSEARGALRAAPPRAAWVLALGPGNPGMNLEQLAKEVGKLLQPAGVPGGPQLPGCGLQARRSAGQAWCPAPAGLRRKRHQNG